MKRKRTVPLPAGLRSKDQSIQGRFTSLRAFAFERQKNSNADDFDRRWGWLRGFSDFLLRLNRRRLATSRAQKNTRAADKGEQPIHDLICNYVRRKPQPCVPSNLNQPHDDDRPDFPFLLLFSRQADFWHLDNDFLRHVNAIVPSAGIAQSLHVLIEQSHRVGTSHHIVGIK